MKKLRAIVALLLCIALPYTAVANMVCSLQCDLDSDAQQGVEEIQHDHSDAAAPHDGVTDHQPESGHHHDHGGAAKCPGAGGSAAVATPGSSGLAVLDGDVDMVTPYRPSVSDAHDRSLFRPPIMAPLSAA